MPDLNLSITTTNGQALKGIARTADEVAAMCKSIKGDIGSLTVTFDKLNAISLRQMTEQISFARAAVNGLVTVVLEANKGLWDLSGIAGDVSKAVKGIGSAAGQADTTVKSLGANAIVAGDGLSDMGAGADLGAKALTDVAGEAKAASTSLSGLNRTVTNTITRVDTLSTAKFDPAGIIAGADAATVALARTAEVAGEVRAATKGGFGGGRVSGGESAAEGVAAGGWRAALGLGARAFRAGAIGITALGGAAAWNTAKFETEAQKIAGNTNMSPADEIEMRRSALESAAMGQDNLQKALMSFMHIANHEFSGAGARRINRGAATMAVSTGADQEMAGNVISGFMHNLGLSATDENVSRVMNLIHQATASGNLTLEQMNQYGFSRGIGPTMSLAKTNEGQVRAAVEGLAFITALTQHTVQAPQAATNLRGITWQIVHPTAKSQKHIDALGLQEYFGDGALDRFGLRGVLEAARQRTGGNRQKLLDIFGNRNGGYGAAIATGAGWKDFNADLDDPTKGNWAAWNGQAKPIEARKKQADQTPGVKLQKLIGRIKQAVETPGGIGDKFIDDFTKLEPILEKVAMSVVKVMDAFTKLPAPVQQAVVAFGTFSIIGHALETFTGLGELLPKVGSGLSLIARAMGLAGGEAATAGGAIEALSGPIGWVIAVAAGLALAWKTDFGGIREVANGVVKNVTDWWKKNLPEIQETVKTVTAAMALFWKDHGKEITAIASSAWKVVGTVITTALNLIEGALTLWMDVINGHWDKFWNDLYQTIDKAVKGWQGIVSNGLQLIAHVIINFAQEVYGAAAKVGNDIVQGIVDGIRNKISQVSAVMTAIGSVAEAAISTRMERKSPSKVMHRVGEDVAQGLIDGINSKSAQVQAAMDRLAIISRFNSLRAGTHSRSERARLSTEESGELTDLKVHGLESAHGNDAFFNNTDMGLAHYSAKWRAGGADNQSFLAYAKNAQASMVEFGTTHKQWLQENSEQARQFEALWKRIDQAISQATGKIQKANAEAAKIAARNERFTTRDQDRIMDTRFQMGDVDASTAMGYFQDRLSEMGKPTASDTPDKWEEYADVLAKVKQLQDQIAEGERAGIAGALQTINDKFQTGALKVGDYVSQLQGLKTQLSVFEAATGRTSDDPTFQPLSKTIDGMINAVDLSKIKSEVADAMRYAKAGKDASGADYSKSQGVSDLKALLPLVPDQSALSTEIKNDIAALSTDPKVSAAAEEFWKAVMAPAEQLLQDTMDNFFKPKSKRMSGAQMWKSFSENEMNSALKLGEGGMQKYLTKQIGDPLQGKGMQSLFKDVPNLFKESKLQMVEGASAVYGAANALMSAFGVGGRKKKSGGLLGGLIGLAAGSLLPGLGLMGGFSLGSNLGGMLGFAGGGMPPVGVPSLVGERGPELFVPRIPGTILPAGLSEMVMSGAGRPVVHNETTIYNGAIYQAADVDQHYQRNSQRRERSTRTPGSIPTTF